MGRNGRQNIFFMFGAWIFLMTSFATFSLQTVIFLATNYMHTLFMILHIPLISHHSIWCRMVKSKCCVSYLYQSLLRIELGFTDGTRQLMDSLQGDLSGSVEQGILQNLSLLCANGQSDYKTAQENNLLHTCEQTLMDSFLEVHLNLTLKSPLIF